MLNLIRGWITRQALTQGRFLGLFQRLCRPTGEQMADYMRRWGGFHHYGEGGCFTVGANVTDPAYVSIGRNVTLSVCTLLGHDASATMLSIAYGKKLDAVGKVVIGNDCFIGHGAIVMPSVTIGNACVIAAGAVVTRDVPSKSVVAGIPARIIMTTDELVERMESKTQSYPWAALIQRREGAFDPALEPRLREMRVRYFFPDDFPAEIN